MRDNMESDSGKEKQAKDLKDLDSSTVFYYSREHRLSRASPAVQAFNETGAARPGIIQRIFVTRRNALMFVPIILICVVIALANNIGRIEKNVKLGGNNLTAVITRMEGTLILDVIKKAPKTGEYYYGAMDISVLPVKPKSGEGDTAELPPAFSHRILLTAADSETFSISLPFDENEFVVLFRSMNEFKSLKLKVMEVK